MPELGHGGKHQAIGDGFGSDLQGSVEEGG
jgi:hypothetical protein